ncbi:MAG: nucleotidyl transferase AbiEii/AbiGii toxin family protein [bacterium]
MELFDKFVHIIETLNKHQVDYILIGGFAVIIYGMPRLTQDIDIFVKMTRKNFEKLRSALDSIYRDDSIQGITADEIKEYSVIRYGTPDGFYIDVMGRLGEVATYDDIEFQEVEVDRVSVKIATPSALYGLKKDTIRPEDKRDAAFLKELLNKLEKKNVSDKI